MIDSVRCTDPRPAHRIVGFLLTMILFLTTGCGQSADEPRSAGIPNSTPEVAPRAPSDLTVSTPAAGAGDASTASSTTVTTPATTAEPPAVADGPLPDSTSSETPAAAPAGAKKPKREPIYDTETSGEELIAAALQRAKRDHKHVLIEFGGNWCGWCYKLHDVFSKNEVVRPIVFEEYELVLVDEGKNQDLMLRYGGKDRQYSFPHLTILDSDGQVLTNQETGSLEKGPEHDPQLVADFLQKWIPTKQDAEQLVSDALTTARTENKRVLVRAGTPYCGWCKILAQFLQDHEHVFATDYVDLKLDTMRMTHGEQVAARFEPKGGGGIPWMVIVDASGNVLTTSIGPEGNIGYPYKPGEISHFLTMLRETRQNLSDGDLAQIETDLNRYRTDHE